MRLSDKRGGKSLKGQRRKTLKRPDAPKPARHRAAVTSDLQEQLEQRTRELDEALQQQKSTSEVLRVISSSPGELQPVFNAMLENATRICAAKFGILYRCEGDALRTVATHGAPQSFVEERQRNPIVSPNPDTTLGRALSTKQPVQIADIWAEIKDFDDRAAQLPKLAGARTVLAVPMVKGNELLGAILIYRQEVRPFTEKQIELVATFADQAVIAIENARLFDEVKARTEDLGQSLEYQTATSEVLSIISRSPTDVQPVFEAIAASALRLCGAKWSVVTRFDGAQLHLAALHNLSDPEGVDAIRKIFPRPLSRGGPTDRAILTGTVINLPDVLKDPEYIYQSISNSAGYRSHLAVPMSRDGNAVGAITVAGEYTAAFTDRHVNLLKAFADQAVIAIENAQLFNEVQAKTRDLEESLQQQTATSEVLQVINSAPGELVPVFDAMLERAMRLCQAAFGGLWIFEGDRYVATALRGVPQDYADYLSRTTVVPGPFTAPYRFRQGESSGHSKHRPRRRGAIQSWRPATAGTRRSRWRANGAASAASPGRRSCWRNHRLPPRGEAILGQADRTAPELRGAGGHRDRERATIQRNQGGARAADRDRRHPEGDCLLAVGCAAGVRRHRDKRQRLIGGFSAGVSLLSTASITW